MESLIQSMSKVLIDPKYADLEIRCGGKRYAVHRVVVCNHSKVLARECDGNFKEAQSRVIEHGMYDARAVDRMLQFMYRGDYVLDTVVPCVSTLDTGAEESQGVPMWDGARLLTQDANEDRDREQPSPPKDIETTEDPLIAHVFVYAIADYYEIQELKDVALQKFTKEQLARKTIGAEELLQVARILYEHTSTEAIALRAQLLDLSYRHPTAAVESEVFMKAVAGQQELQEYSADFMSELVRRHRVEREEDAKSHQEAVKKVKQDLGRAHNLATNNAATVHLQEKQRLEARLSHEAADYAILKSSRDTAQKQIAQLLAVSTMKTCKLCAFGTEFDTFLNVTDYCAQCRSCKKRNVLPVAEQPALFFFKPTVTR